MALSQEIKDQIEQLMKETERKKELAEEIKKLFESDQLNEQLIKDSKYVLEEFGFLEEMLKISDRKAVLNILQSYQHELDETLKLLADKINPKLEETKKTFRDGRTPQVSDYFHSDIAYKMKTDSAEALSYVTPFRQARDVSQHILKLFETLFDNIPSNIYDATGGIGGNTFGFLDILRDYYYNYHRVYVKSVEMDSNRCTCLRDNLKVYLNRYKPQNVACQAMEGNFLELWKEFPTHQRENSLVMIDAPWGNSDYSKHSIIYDLYLFDTNQTQRSVNDISRDLIYNDGVSMVVLKVPIHYSEQNLLSNNEKQVKVQSYLIRKSKYLIIYKV